MVILETKPMRWQVYVINVSNILHCRFRAGPMEDGKWFKCKVTVPGIGSQTATAKIQVKCMKAS